MIMYKFLTWYLAQSKFSVKLSSSLLFLPSSTCQFITLPRLFISLKMLHAPKLPAFPPPPNRNSYPLSKTVSAT